MELKEIKNQKSLVRFQLCEKLAEEKPVNLENKKNDISEFKKVSKFFQKNTTCTQMPSLTSLYDNDLNSK